MRNRDGAYRADGIWVMACLALALVCITSVAQAAPSKGRPDFAADFSEARLNQLLERDRPRDLATLPASDAKSIKATRAAITRFATIAARYRVERKVALHRQMLDLLNRHGLGDGIDSQGLARVAFRTLHEVGPPLDDPENGGNVEFAQLRHFRYMRILAMLRWRGRFTTIEEQRVLAPYMRDCELRPSLTRPTRNGHDPSCGYFFEADYPPSTQGERYDPSKILSFQDFIDGRLGEYQVPPLTMFTQYPLHLPEGDSSGRRLWIGNAEALQAVYDRDRVTSLAYRAPRAALAEAERKTQWAEAQRRAAAVDSAIKAWHVLWNRTDLTAAEQAELEQLSFATGEMGRYMSRYRLISHDYIAFFCSLGRYDRCPPPTQPGTSGTASSGTWAPSSQIVTVRSYDAYGNYTGSSTTTRIDATLMGAKP